ncbi:baseplate J/gp47 family protein [Gemmata sp. JC717]|uniref:baseplate J/gp47 family protein n=1 Tax=Gemmata algarum TaxID=2975278 RepID=UPI0021BB7DE7|nr:baseplate J/gp47 family protein [Gemmata algarum]MDY3551395.1 baseplate J/gp47 family protein [Gemmata algarum]
MPLQTYRFTEIVSGIATATQAAASALVDFSVGSVLRALAQAVAGQLLWLQAIVLQLLTLTRASTSSGTDLDSWCADFGFARLPARAATGQVTFSRFTAGQQAVVPVGTTVQATDGSQTFAVTIDTSNSAYNAALGGYVLPANTASVNVPVQAAAGGAAGNVQAGSITVITSAVTGVDSVTNASAFLNGADAEADDAFRARFVLYLASLSKATKSAIGSAVLGVQQGLNYTITENEDYSGAYDPGYFYVVVDDGTGTASSGLLAAVGTAVEGVRGFTTGFGVFAPVPLAANVAMTVTSAPGYSHPAVVGAVGNALRDFLNGLTLGVDVPYTQLASVAYGVPGVLNVTAVTLNGGTADLVASQKQRVVAGTVTVA